MSKVSVLDSDATINPIDLVEDVAGANVWASDRQSADELAIQVTGQWCDMQMWFAWRPESHSLFITCALDMRVPEGSRAGIYPLLAKINERLWIGHFELWSDEGWPTFRHTLMSTRESPISVRVVEDVIDAARSECDRFYPAFQFVIWGGRDPDEAIDAALIEPVGRA